MSLHILVSVLSLSNLPERPTAETEAAKESKGISLASSAFSGARRAYMVSIESKGIETTDRKLRKRYTAEARRESMAEKEAKRQTGGKAV